MNDQASDWQREHTFPQSSQEQLKSRPLPGAMMVVDERQEC